MGESTSFVKKHDNKGTRGKKKRDVAVSALARYARRRIAVVCGLAGELVAQHQAGAVHRRKRDTTKATAARLANQSEKKRRRIDADNDPAVGS